MLGLRPRILILSLFQLPQSKLYEANATIEGFYINYRDVTNANEYIKETVDSPIARSCLITHLGPGKTYEFKLQSFNASAGSDFSAILTQQTLAAVTEITISNDVISKGTAVDGDTNKLRIYVIIGATMGGIALLTGLILALILCKRYRQKKAQNLTSQGM